jgi:predicted nucleotidyltransferase
MSIEENFAKFASKLEISSIEARKVARLQNRIREYIETNPQVIRTEIIGSYDRKTKIRPLHDIDIFVIFHPDTYVDKYGNPIHPKMGVIRVARVVSDLKRKLFGLTGPKIQNRSVNITIHDIGFDLVPAYELSRGGYVIPDQRHGQWILTDPIKYAAILSELNQSSNYSQQLIPFIKMVKYWATQKAKYLNSYLTELFVLSSLDHIWGYRQACTAFFSNAKETVRGPLPDPATGNDVNDLKLLQKVVLSNRLRESAEAAKKAVNLENEGKVLFSMLYWQKIFGKEFPR